MKRFTALACGSIILIALACHRNPPASPEKVEEIRVDTTADLVPFFDSAAVYLALSYPADAKRPSNDLVIFARISKGNYFLVADWDNVKNCASYERDTILPYLPEFIWCSQGREKKIHIDSTGHATFQCAELTVGKFNAEPSMRGPVLTANVPLPCSKLHKKITAGSDAATYRLITQAPMFDSLRGIGKVSYEITRLDNANEYCCIAQTEDDETAISLLCFLEISDGKPVLNTCFRETLPADSWGRGHAFFDLRDLDGDGNAEILLLFDGYEWTAVQVYKKEHGRFILKIDNTIYGC